MSDKFLNNTGLAYYHDRIKALFATKTELATKQDTLESGTNIKTLNNQSLLGSGNIDLDTGAMELVDNPTTGDVLTTDATGQAVDSGLALSDVMTGSDVASAISTALANSGDPYTTESDVNSAIATAVASAYKYKGSVATVADLPSTGQTVGDVYDVQESGINYAWDGTSWDPLGQLVDTSVLWTSASGQSNSLIAITTAEIDNIITPPTP